MNLHITSSPEALARAAQRNLLKPSQEHPDGLLPFKPEAGDLVDVTFNDGTQRFKRITVRFLDEIDGEYVLDGRPLAGTSRIRVGDVRVIERSTRSQVFPFPRAVS